MAEERCRAGDKEGGDVEVSRKSSARGASEANSKQWVGSAWRAAAELAVPWETVRDELRDQMFEDAQDKDLSPPNAAETAELLRRRREMEKELALRVDPQVEVMRGQVRTGANKTDVRPLLRAATFKQLNAEDHEGSDTPGAVWAADVMQPDVSRRWFALSAPTDGIDFFISHSWDDDGDAKGLIGRGATTKSPDALAEFGWRKSVAFGNVVRTIKEMTGADKHALAFWTDKVCVPQFDVELKTACIASFEAFIAASGGLVVLWTPRYVRRLWCVYEMCCFLCTKPIARVFVNLRSFACDENRATYLEAIRNFDIASCECKVEYDKRILRDKVAQFYQSDAAFARFAQAALVSLALRDLFSYPPLIKTRELFAEHATPWLELLHDLGFADLHAAWGAFDVVAHYTEVSFDDDKFIARLQKHLGDAIYPLLDSERVAACTVEGLKLYQGGAVTAGASNTK